MCGSFASSSWSKEEKYHKVKSKDSPNHYDYWTDNNLFWEDLEKIKNHPLIPKNINIYGFIYDVKTGKLESIESSK